jgi:multiple sugar transport system permease protein
MGAILQKDSYFNSIKRKRKIFNAIVLIILIISSVVFLVPFFWMISTSLKSSNEVWNFPVTWIPKVLRFDNYTKALTVVPFPRYILNTFIIALIRIIGQVVACSIAAYSFARLKFPGKNILFILMLSTLMLPGIVTMIPQFVYFSELGWVNSWLPLTIPMLFATPFNTFLLRQFYLSLPKELDEAAKIDGCNTWEILLKILAPLTAPAVMVIVVFAFMDSWNDFMGPLLYLRDDNLFTVSLALTFFRSRNNTDWQLLMAASTIAMIPTLLVFAFAQKYIIGGIAMTGVKA